jgi:hypothetical protein
MLSNGGLLVVRIFGKKKEAKVTEQVKMSDLEQLCGGDEETYNALSPIMFLDPRKIAVPMTQAADNAKKGEKEKDSVSARMWYEVAGGLAIYEGNVKKVIEYYEGAQRVTGQKYLILNNPEKAIAKAQEYYKKYLHD